jgi:hypothetical protein
MVQSPAVLAEHIRNAMSLVRGAKTDPSYTSPAAAALEALAQRAVEGDYPGKTVVLSAIEQAGAAHGEGNLADALQHLSRALVTVTRQ